MILVIPVEVNGPLNQFMWKRMEMHLGLDSALPNSGYPPAAAAATSEMSLAF